MSHKKIVEKSSITNHLPECNIYRILHSSSTEYASFVNPHRLFKNSLIIPNKPTTSQFKTTEY
jgi:hypothetical protein